MTHYCHVAWHMQTPAPWQRSKPRKRRNPSNKRPLRGVLFVEIVEALVFMNILLITIPPLIVYLFFNRQIVAGMTAGAVKG